MKPLFDTQNCLIQPYYPIGWPYDDWIGDSTRRPRKDDEQIKQGWAELIEKLKNPTTSITYSTEQQVWFNNEDGGVTFIFAVPGCGKEDVTAEIKDDVLRVNGSYRKALFSKEWVIPSPKSLDLENVSAKVEHGLLEIVFHAKKQEVKMVKVL